MPRRLITTLALTLALAVRCGPAPGLPLDLDALLTRALTEFDAPGAALVVVRHGRLAQLGAAGEREAGTGRPVTPDTLFALASCTKAFTAAACAALIDEGRMAWDDPVRAHLPGFRLADPEASAAVTLRDLLCHRTGMPAHDWLWTGADVPADELVLRYGLARPSGRLRATWEYANVPYMACALAAARADGRPWPEVLRARLFGPLGMRGATCSVREALAAPDVASPHVAGPGGVRAAPWEPCDPADGSGAVIAAARDLVPWLQLHLADGAVDGRRVLSAAQLRATHAGQVDVIPYGRFGVYYPAEVTTNLRYGLGWFVGDYRGHRVVAHGGSLAGFRVAIFLAPDQGCGVAVLVNRGNTFLPECVGRVVLDHLLGLPRRDWFAFHHQARREREGEAREGEAREGEALGVESAGLPAGCAGGYTEPAYGRAVVSVTPGGPELRWQGRVFRLAPRPGGEFAAMAVAPAGLVRALGGRAERGRFAAGPDGRVGGMTFLGQEFRREKP